MKNIPGLMLIMLTCFSVASGQSLTACCNDTICLGDSVQLSYSTTGTVGSTIVISDDTYSDTINIGFPFTFFGNTYSKCVISTNGFISFNTDNALQFSPWQIILPSPSIENPLNAIYGPWQDLDPSQPPFGGLSYQTLGVAPNRYFVFNICDVPMYQCNDTLGSQEIILYEGTNIIETQIGEKKICETWNTEAAIHGLQDSSGNNAVIVAGRNYPDVWTASQEGTRFTPDGNSYTISTIPFAPVSLLAGTPLWYDSKDSLIAAFDSLIFVHPDTTTSYYVTLGNCGYVSDTITIVVSCPTAITEPAAANNPASIYPNPNSGTFQLRLPYGNGFPEYEIINCVGQRIQSGILSRHNESYWYEDVTMPQDDKGFFYLVVKDATGTYCTKTMIF